MKDQCIVLKTAKLAKEKGFNIGCNGSYTEFLKTHKSDNPSFAMKKGEVEYDDSFFFINNNSMCDYSNENYTMYAAPSQSLLQRWLREVHSIEVFVKPFYIPQLNREGCFKYYGLVVLKDCVGDCNASSLCKDKYEDALEDALKLAFNFVK
jgi:hypothetical protein